MKKTKKQTRKIFVTLGVLILVALATGIPNVSATWTSDAPIAVDTIIKKEGTGSIRVTSNQTNNIWNNVSSIVSGLGTMANESRVTVFKMGSTWYLISSNATDFKGFNWTGSTWQSDSAIISGLYPDADTMPAPNTFYKDAKWYLIVGNQTGKFRGYNWTGSAWQNDSVIASGLGDVGSMSTPFVFHKSGTWFLISGDSAGTFSGFNWSGSTWQSDSAIVSGLGDVGAYSSPSAFYKDSKWYLISGEQTGIFNGYNWSGTTWVADAGIVEGTYQLSGSSYLGAVFEGSSDFGDVSWYLISGHSVGDFIGFYWTDEYTPTCYFQNDFVPPLSVTNVSKKVGFLVLWYYTYNATKINSYVNISIYTDDSNYMYWEINKTYFNNTWNDLYLPLSEGAEVGTLDLSSISKFRLEIPGTEDPEMVHRVDYLRFVEYPYTLHNIYLEPVSEGGIGVSFPVPHIVRFFVQDIYGNPKQNVEVTATCVQTTMGLWSWLYDIFGFKTKIELENTTMSGTTDSAGSISFVMVETIKYNIHFKNTTQSINENLTIYPKSERYTVIIGRTGFFDVEAQLFGEQINWGFTMEKINTTAAWLNFTYNDTLSQTTSGSYYVSMVNETTGLEKINTSNVTYFCSTPVNIDSSVWSYNCIVHEYRGNTYILGFNATHTTAGEFEEAVSVFFRYNHPLIQFSGWEDTGYYQLLSICLLIFFGMLFTGVTLKIGAILLPLAGWVLFGIGWFSPTDNLVTGAILLGIATAVGAGVFMTTSGREKNLAS